MIPVGEGLRNLPGESRADSAPGAKLISHGTPVLQPVYGCVKRETRRLGFIATQ